MEALSAATRAYQEALERFRRGCELGLPAEELDALADDLSKAQKAVDAAWLHHGTGITPERVAQIEREHAEAAREQTRILSAAAWAPENTDPPPSQGGLVQKVKAVLSGLLNLLSELSIPTYAAAAAGVLAPIVLGLFGKNFDPAVIAGWLAIVGAAATGLEKILRSQSAPAPKPAPPAPTPPTPPAPPAPPSNPAGPTPKAK